MGKQDNQSTTAKREHRARKNPASREYWLETKRLGRPKQIWKDGQWQKG